MGTNSITPQRNPFDPDPLMQFIDLAAQQQQQLADGRTLRQVIDARMAAVLDHGQYILGPEVAELEQRLGGLRGGGALRGGGQRHAMRC